MARQSFCTVCHCRLARARRHPPPITVAPHQPHRICAPRCCIILLHETFRFGLPLQSCGCRRPFEGATAFWRHPTSPPVPAGLIGLLVPSQVPNRRAVCLRHPHRPFSALRRAPSIISAIRICIRTLLVDLARTSLPADLGVDVPAHCGRRCSPSASRQPRSLIMISLQSSSLFPLRLQPRCSALHSSSARHHSSPPELSADRERRLRTGLASRLPLQLARLSPAPRALQLTFVTCNFQSQRLR